MPGPPGPTASNAFNGFSKPTQNWFKMPNEWTNITAQLGSLAEIKVVEYVLKHTWGYQEYGGKKRITNDEFMLGRKRKDGTRIDDGTGLSKPSVIAGLRLAVQDGLLLEEIDSSDRARVKKSYSLRMASDIDRGNSSAHQTGHFEAEGSEGKNLNAGVKNFNPRGKDSLHRSEQETLERNIYANVDSNPSLQNSSSRRTESRSESTDSSGVKSLGEVMESYGRPSHDHHLSQTDDEEILRRDYVATELARELNDQNGLGCFRTIAEKIPQQIVFEKLALVKELDAEGKIRSNPAALFVYYIKQYAKDKQIDLNFGSNR